MCTHTGAGQPHRAASAIGPNVPAALAGPTASAGPSASPARPDLRRPRLAELRALRRDAQRDEADLSYVRRLVQGRIDILRAELARRADLPRGHDERDERDAAARDGLGAQCGAPGPGERGGAGEPEWRGRLPGGARPVSADGAHAQARAMRRDAVDGPGRRGAQRTPLVGRLSEILADQPARHRSSARHVRLGTPHSAEYGQLAAEMLAEVQLSDLDARTDDELSTAMGRLVAYEQQVSRRRQELQHIADDCGAEITRRYREGEAQVDDLLA